MTEEEIIKLADHYISEKFPLNHQWEKGDEHRAFIAGVHSRDEEVKKLEDEIEELEQALAFAEDVVDVQKKKIEQFTNQHIGCRLKKENKKVTHYHYD